MTTPAIALTIAGSDSGGGAGIQADIKTFSALGVYGASAITALTAQNTEGVRAIHDVPADMVRQQLSAVLEDLSVGAIKIGMLSRVETIETVADVLESHAAGIPVVLDPVMVATSGDLLLQQDAVDGLRQRLLPLAALATPNLPELEVLTSACPGESVGEMGAAGRKLLAAGCAAVLVKGGHMTGDICNDLLVTPDAPPLVMKSPRLQSRNTHGTGCTLSSAIAALLAKGRPLAQAVGEAHAYLQAALAAAVDMEIGRGHGPVHHFHAHW